MLLPLPLLLQSPCFNSQLPMNISGSLKPSASRVLSGGATWGKCRVTLR